jgi:hypothetical protein
MSLELLKEVIENYDSKSMTSDQIEGLRVMLEHDVFEPLYPIIVKKIHELKEILDKQEKIDKSLKKAKDKVESSYKRNEIPKQPLSPPTENIILSFTFDVPPEELLRQHKKYNYNKKKAAKPSKPPKDKSNDKDKKDT